MQIYYSGWRGTLSCQIKPYSVSTLRQSSPGSICTSTSPSALLGLAVLMSFLNLWELQFCLTPGPGSEALGLELKDVCYKKPPKWFWCPKVLRTIGVQDGCLDKRLGGGVETQREQNLYKGKSVETRSVQILPWFGYFNPIREEESFPVLLGSSGCSRGKPTWAPKSSSTIVLYVSAERLQQGASG